MYGQAGLPLLLGREGHGGPAWLSATPPLGKVCGAKASQWTQCLLTADWRNPVDLPTPPPSFCGKLDGHPTSLLYLPMDPLPPTEAPPCTPHHLALPLIMSQGLTVYTLYIVPVPITSCWDPEPSTGESFICHFETYLLVRVLLFCPNCANCPSLACNP